MKTRALLHLLGMQKQAGPRPAERDAVKAIWKDPNNVQRVQDSIAANSDPESHGRTDWGKVIGGTVVDTGKDLYRLGRNFITRDLPATAKAIAYDTPRDLVHATRGAVNGTVNWMTGAGYTPNSGIAGTVDNSALTRVHDAFFAPIVAADDLKNRALLGSARIADIAGAPFGRERNAKDWEKWLNYNHEKLRHSLYSDPDNPAGVVAAEKPIADASLLAMELGSGAAIAKAPIAYAQAMAKAVPMGIETVTRAGRDPSYGATHGVLGDVTVPPVQDDSKGFSDTSKIMLGMTPTFSDSFSPLGQANILGHSLSAINGILDKREARSNMIAKANEINKTLEDLKTVYDYADAVGAGDMEKADEYRSRVESILNAYHITDNESFNNAFGERLSMLGIGPEDLKKPEFAGVFDRYADAAREAMNYNVEELNRGIADDRGAAMAYPFFFGVYPKIEHLVAPAVRALAK